MAGIYIHVPFCKTRCIYCDFYTRTDISPKGDYISALSKEMSLRKDYIQGEKVKTIYFGGGTPSLLTHDDFSRIFESINANFDMVQDAEITLEANPDDLSPHYVEMLQKLPFNRLSIGVQSFDDRELTFLKRRDSSQKAIEAVRLSKDAGFNNISIDLIYGLPNQTLSIWQKNLDIAIDLDIQHLSSYHLIYEQGTRLYKLFRLGEVHAVDEDVSVNMFSEMINKLTSAGFEQYEISNFARKGLYSKHNSSYWLGDKYLGLGPAAHSFDGNNRAWNVASISKYISSIAENKPDMEIEILNLDTRYNEFILTGMRTMWGVNLNTLEKRFGADYKTYCMKNARKYIDSGYVTIDSNVMKLTRKGIFISDGIMSDLMSIK